MEPNRMNKMLLTLNILILFIAGISCELIVTHVPSHVQLLPATQDLKTSQVQHVINSMFGFTINEDLPWDGLGAGDLFKRPKANALFSVEVPSGVKLEMPNTVAYNTLQDDPVLDTESVAYNILNIVEKDEKPLLVDLSMDHSVVEIRSHQPELFKDVPSTREQLRSMFSEGQALFSNAQIGSLNISHNADLNFLGELQAMRTIFNALQAQGPEIQGRLPNFFHFRIRGLEKVATEHGTGSIQLHDARELLQDTIQQITSLLRDLYADNVVVEVVTLVPEDPTHSRKTRHLMQTDADPTKAPASLDLNLASDWSDMYPVTFNIILWFTVVMVITLYGIAYGIWFMDPGRDSIIYRMTSQRIKKD